MTPTSGSWRKKKAHGDRRAAAAPVKVDRRRAERRRDRRVSIELWVEQEEGDALYFQRLANISTGGVYFAQTIPERIGTRVKLRFTLPGSSDEIACAGEIVSARKGQLGMGVKLLGLSPRARSLIADIVEKVSR